MLDREFQWFDEQLKAEEPEKDPSLLADGGQEEDDDS
jgi:cytochrome c oxidase subunit 1